jgi:hypothetical protein
MSGLCATLIHLQVHEVLVNVAFVLEIEMSRALIEKEDAWLSIQCTG